jgi:hypothetical protein
VKHFSIEWTNYPSIGPVIHCCNRNEIKIRKKICVHHNKSKPSLLLQNLTFSKASLSTPLVEEKRGGMDSQKLLILNNSFTTMS